MKVLFLICNSVLFKRWQTPLPPQPPCRPRNTPRQLTMGDRRGSLCVNVCPDVSPSSFSSHSLESSSFCATFSLLRLVLYGLLCVCYKVIFSLTQQFPSESVEVTLTIRYTKTRVVTEERMSAWMHDFTWRYTRYTTTGKRMDREWVRTRHQSKGGRFTACPAVVDNCF